jgi:hypothetical protein
VSEKRSATRALLLLLARSSRLDSTPRFAELSLGAELIFLLHRKTERLTESLTDASQLAGSGRSRIVGCCNRRGRGPRCLGFLRCAAYINSCPAIAAHIWNRSRVFATSRCLRRLRSLPHLERRRAPTNERAGLRNHSPLRSCTGKGELGFWKALCATARVLHHGSPSFQVGRCSLPPSALTGLLQHCHQQCYYNDYICKRAVRAVYCCLSVRHVLRVHVSLLLVSVHLAV